MSFGGKCLFFGEKRMDQVHIERCCCQKKFDVGGPLSSFCACVDFSVG